VNRFWRALLLCILAISLPLQGAAAAAMVHCAAVPIHESSAADSEAANHHVAAPAEVSVGEMAAMGDGAAPSEWLSKAHAAGTTGHQCSACAACCFGLALPSEHSSQAAEGRSSLPQPAADDSVVSFISSGLERPPRSDLS
jgi:hypothetical protein